jgi:hypothetical protein
MCPECVFVALVVKHAMRERHTRIVICGMSGSTTFFHTVSKNRKILGEKLFKYEASHPHKIRTTIKVFNI